MNGATALVKTLLANKIDVCFANPGTSEMHFVAALDKHPEMRCVLGLHENVVTGAADGYARMLDKPAATLLHLGPGLSNGAANIHNARKARTGMVNIVGDHATYHRKYDAPLTSDIEGLAHTVSDYVHTSLSADQLSSDAATAILKAREYPGRISSLILPADSAWTETESTIAQPTPNQKDETPDTDKIKEAIRILSLDEPVLLLLGGRVLREEPLRMAGKIANSKPTVSLRAETSNARFERGAGRVHVERIPYPINLALNDLKGFKHAILIEAEEPVAFFAYPEKPSKLLPEDCEILELASPQCNGPLALEMLVEELGLQLASPTLNDYQLPDLSFGPLTPDNIGPVIAKAMPENAIVVDEALTSGRSFSPATRNAAPHSWLQLVGGAIGIGIPLAVGAAIACPDRPVVTLQADGSGMYTLQGLWTQARENLNVTTIIFHNQRYNILYGEMKNVGVVTPEPSAIEMFDLQRPSLDWLALAKGMGVEGGRANDTNTLYKELVRGLTSEGPYLIEAAL